MKTKILSPNAIDQAAELIKKGEAIAFPTETVYGLGALKEASDQIYAIKQRPKEKLLTPHFASVDQVKAYFKELPPQFSPLAKAFLPGPLALIVSYEGKTIAIRVPDHPVTASLIQKLGAPLFATSANLSGNQSPQTVEEVLKDLEGKIPAIIDGGKCQIGVPSTIVDLTSLPVKIVREGMISKEQIHSALT